jgi:hypothetical protein
MKMTVFWDIAPCNLLEVYRRFRSFCCLHHQGDESQRTVIFMKTLVRNLSGKRPLRRLLGLTKGYVDQDMIQKRAEQRRWSTLGCCHILYFTVNVVYPDDGGSISKTSVNFYQTARCNISEDSHLHFRRRENF